MPDPRDYTMWQRTALWIILGQPTQNASYETMRKHFAQIFKDEEIFIRKVTHALRVLAARVGDEAGLSDQVSGMDAAAADDAVYVDVLRGTAAAPL